MLKLDLIQTVAFAGVVLFAGYAIRNRIRVLARYNIPAPVVGGLLVAVGTLVARRFGVVPFAFDTTLQAPLMTAFFTGIGFGASLTLLKVGGPHVARFFLLATVVAVAQNLVGIAVALPFGLDPLFGVLAGSVTLTGGPATGLAFAPLFEEAGVAGAASIAVAAAMAGIVAGGVLGGPVGTALIERRGLRPRPGAARPAPVVPTPVELPARSAQGPEGDDRRSFVLLKNVVAILVAMWVGSWVSRGFAALGITLPAYIGAMLVAATIRNLDDRTRAIRLSPQVIDDIGSGALSLFIVLALMTLDLGRLAGLALPLLTVLVAQVALIAAVGYWIVHRTMGRDYESAVITSGFCGFMLGTTANAMANMESLVERYGAAPRAFLVVPIVGAFLIDFTNAIIITVFLNAAR